MFRDYEADYSATLSAEEAEQQAEQGGGVQGEEEEEEGRGKTVTWHAAAWVSSTIHQHPFFLFLHPQNSRFFSPLGTY